MVYENCKIYGPYSSKKDRRLRIFVIFPDEKRTTISYPKYLMEVHLNKYLEPNETVDHIDGNFLNNEISNLQILDRKIHCCNDANRNKDVTVTCMYCGKSFTIKGNTIRNRNRTDKHQSGYFCSKVCSGKYGKQIQLGLKQHQIVNKIKPDTYKVKSAQEETLDVEAG